MTIKKAKRGGSGKGRNQSTNRRVAAKAATKKAKVRNAPKRAQTKQAAATKPASESDSAKGWQCVRPSSKLGKIIAMLQQTDGSSIAEIAKATGWQKHSVHGAISGTLRTKMGLEVQTEVRDGVHYYRLVG